MSASRPVHVHTRASGLGTRARGHRRKGARLAGDGLICSATDMASPRPGSAGWLTSTGRGDRARYRRRAPSRGWITACGLCWALVPTATPPKYRSVASLRVHRGPTGWAPATMCRSSANGRLPMPAPVRPARIAKVATGDSRMGAIEHPDGAPGRGQRVTRSTHRDPATCSVCSVDRDTSRLARGARQGDRTMIPRCARPPRSRSRCAGHPRRRDRDRRSSRTAGPDVDRVEGPSRADHTQSHSGTPADRSHRPRGCGTQRRPRRRLVQRGCGQPLGSGWCSRSYRAARPPSGPRSVA